MFFKIDGYEQFRFRFWKLVRDLFTDSFMGVIGKWCKENGIALFTSGYYSSSSREAGSPRGDYADIIERVCGDPDEYLKICEKISADIRGIYDYEHSVLRELDMFRKDGAGEIKAAKLTGCSDPILSVIIPAYNVQKYIRHTVHSLRNSLNE